MSDSLRPCEVQHARPPCPSPTPGVHPNSRPSSRAWWAAVYGVAQGWTRLMRLSSSISSLEKCLFSSLVHFLIGSCIFLELSCRSCLYIFEISCLSVASFAIIFSHSEGCLFTLLIVSFIVQKLLSLIRSYLFIFVFYFQYSGR